MQHISLSFAAIVSQTDTHVYARIQAFVSTRGRSDTAASDSSISIQFAQYGNAAQSDCGLRISHAWSVCV